MAFNFSSIAHKSILGKLLRFPLQFIPPEAVVPIIQGCSRGKKWIAGSGNHGYWLGSYEFSKQRRFAEIVQSGWTVFDVGAHVGYYSLLASVLVGPGGRVCSFEPSPQNLSFLKKHVQMNDCANVVVVDAAVADYCGVASFDNSRSGFTRQLNSSGSLEVRLITLDSFVCDRDVIADCIKMDIEGAEYQALSGAKQLLADHHPAIFLATHGRSIHHQCCQLLREYEYQFEVLPGKHGETLEDTDEILAY